jgi:hypothetical protein
VGATHPHIKKGRNTAVFLRSYETVIYFVSEGKESKKISVRDKKPEILDELHTLQTRSTAQSSLTFLSTFLGQGHTLLAPKYGNFMVNWDEPSPG